MAEHFLLGIRRIEVEIALLHLQMHQVASERHLADVVSGITFDCYDVALVQVQALGVKVVTLASVLELYFHVGALANQLRSIVHIVIDHLGFVLSADLAVASAVVRVLLARFRLKNLVWLYGVDIFDFLFCCHEISFSAILGLLGVSH